MHNYRNPFAPPTANAPHSGATMDALEAAHAFAKRWAGAVFVSWLAATAFCFTNRFFPIPMGGQGYQVAGPAALFMIALAGLVTVAGAYQFGDKLPRLLRGPALVTTCVLGVVLFLGAAAPFFFG